MGNFTARVWSDSELQESLRQIGPLLPVFEFQCQVLDGHRRDGMCAALGIDCPRREFDTKEEAAPALWAVHPKRALEVFPVRSIQEGARLFRTRASAVAVVSAPTRAESRGPRDYRKERAWKVSAEEGLRYLDRCEQGLEPFTLEGVRQALALTATETVRQLKRIELGEDGKLTQVWYSSRLYALAMGAARQRGQSFAAFVRRTIHAQALETLSSDEIELLGLKASNAPRPEELSPETSLYELDGAISVRLDTALKNAFRGKDTLRIIAASTSERELKSWRNCGKRTQQELIELLAQVGLKLRGSR